MTGSIRTFLIINLLLSVTLITSLSIISNIFFVHKDMQLHMDKQLILMTLHMRAFFSNQQPNLQPFSTMQKNIFNFISVYQCKNGSANCKRAHAAKLNIQERLRKLEFQIWNNKEKLLLRSPYAPLTPITHTMGLSNLWLNDTAWRVNAVRDTHTGLTFIVAEKFSYRQKLENQLTQDSIFIMLITYPFLGFFISAIVGRGLNILKKVANEVHQRTPGFLHPVDLKSVPLEIRPLVSELNHLFEQLKDAFEREKRFTADAAHELRTPLAALNTYAQLALCAKTPDARKQSLLKVLSGVNRCAHVVQQLLTLNRMLPEETIHTSKEIDLSKEAAHIAAQLAPEAIAKKIDLALITSPTNDRFMISGNNIAIGILIRNLVDNAIRYSPEHATVTIKIEKNADCVFLHIIDTGPGIPEQLRKRVFERFFRILGSQTSGSGLGLSIVSQIAKLHKAEIILKTPDNHQGLDFQIAFKRTQLGNPLSSHLRGLSPTECT